ncbi:MAG: hypothetical protein FWG78_03670 [Coriobacteriia bacterium]|nr:hypothetical protein [Coriobacteriia bacterium]
MDVPSQALSIQRLIDSGKPYEVYDAALIEMIFVLEKVKEIERPLIHQVIQAIFSEPGLRCDRELFELAFVGYLEHKSLSFMDCYLVAKATMREGLPLLTFDKALSNKLPMQVSLVPKDALP